MLRINEETLVKSVHDYIENSQRRNEAYGKFVEALRANDKMEMQDSLGLLETVVAEAAYQKGFHDGMRFILNTMAGKDVIEI